MHIALKAYFMFLSLSGLANCFTFFWQSRYANEDLIRWLKDAAPADESFNVQFEAGDAQTISMCAEPGRTSPGCVAGGRVDQVR